MDSESGLLLVPLLLLAVAPPAVVAERDLATLTASVIANSPSLTWTEFQNGLICGESDPVAPECL
jgi:hypothetical protein